MYAQQSLSLFRQILRQAVKITQQHIALAALEVDPADNIAAATRVVSNQRHSFGVN